MAEQNKGVSRRVFQEGWAQGNLAAIDDIFDPGYVLGGQPNGVQRVKDAITRFRAAFPDLEIGVEDVIAEDDRVATRWTLRGTHLAEFGDFRPTGNRIEVSGITIHRAAGGRIVEAWVSWDTLGLRRQLRGE